MIYIEKIYDFFAPKTGHFHVRFGLYVGRPFHLISQLPSRRYLDVSGSGLVIKSQN